MSEAESEHLMRKHGIAKTHDCRHGNRQDAQRGLGWCWAGNEMGTHRHTHTDLRSHSDSQAGTHRTRCVCMCVCVLKMRILQTLITNLGTEHHLRPKKHQETASLGQS